MLHPRRPTLSLAFLQADYHVLAWRPLSLTQQYSLKCLGLMSSSQVADNLWLHEWPWRAQGQKCTMECMSLDTIFSLLLYYNKSYILVSQAGFLIALSLLGYWATVALKWLCHANKRNLHNKRIWWKCCEICFVATSKSWNLYTFYLILLVLWTTAISHCYI